MQPSLWGAPPGCADPSGTFGCPQIDTGSSNLTSSFTASSVPPPGLQLGEQYQLIFVTADSFQATSTNIAHHCRL